MKVMTSKLRALSVVTATAVFSLVATNAMSQGIEVKNQPFVNDSPLPFGSKKIVQAAMPQVASTPVANVIASEPVRSWELRLTDINIATAFQRWASEAGWRIRWDARKHVMVEAPDTIRGSFEDALKSVLEAPGIATSSYPLEVCFYPNTPPLARITRKGEQDKECK